MSRMMQQIFDGTSIKGDIEFVGLPPMPVFRSPVRYVSAIKIVEEVFEIKIGISNIVLAQSLTAYSRIT